MSCNPCNTPPCQPVTFCVPESFGLAFPSLVGPQGPPGGNGLYVTNYDALRALDASQWPDGYQAVVGGYETVGDGGWGLFAYVPSSTTADNDGTVLAPSNGTGRWFRVYSGPVNVRWFGAVGDGSTDDFQAIQNAITYIESLLNGGGVFIPSGEYNIEGQLDFSGDKPVLFFGEGEGSSVINAVGVDIALHLGTGTGDKTIDIRVSGLSIIGSDSAEIGIQVDRLHQILLDRCFIEGFVTAGVDMNMAYNNELRDLFIQDCDRGIIIDENNEYTLITRCKIYSCDGVGIHFRNGSCSGSKVTFCDIEANEVGIQIDAGSAESAESLGIIGCYFKDQVAQNIAAGTDASSLWVDSLLLQNNEIKAGTAGPATNTVELDRCRKPVLMSNTFHSCDVTVTGNTSAVVDLGNTYDASAQPSEFQLGNPSGNLGGTLPTVDPAVTDEWFNNSGVMEISP
jgi:hypothetical protein